MIDSLVECENEYHIVIMTTIQEIQSKIEEIRSRVLKTLREIQELDSACKSCLKLYLSDPQTINSSSKLKIQGILDYMHEKINIGNWKEVKLFIRKTITIATYIKLLAYLKSSDNFTEDVVKEGFKIIDFGLLFGCPLDGDPNILHDCATVLNSVNSTLSSVNIDIRIATKTSTCDNTNAIPIGVLDCPSMEYFYKNHILTETPVILKNCMKHWPALMKWNDQNYFLKLAGLRTVSVELGSKYTDTDWTQKLMTIEEFIRKHVYESDGPTGYLAQYQLFDQIPELKADISTPEYCCFSEKDEPVDINAWYGPRGTVSPLHHDPKKNLLCQVIGEKQLYLFNPEDSEYLYPHEHELLNNTAQVDPRNPDLEKHPKYKEAKAYYCVLKPGEMLYIPPKWWHFVESLSISFSVSFWWE